MAQNTLTVPADSYLAGMLSYGMLQKYDDDYVLSGFLNPENVEAVTQLESIGVSVSKYNASGRLVFRKNYSSVKFLGSSDCIGTICYAVSDDASLDYIRGMVDFCGTVDVDGLTLNFTNDNLAPIAEKMFEKLPYNYERFNGSIRFDIGNAARLIVWCGSRYIDTFPTFRYTRTDPDAMAPTKAARDTDSGYDMKLVRLLKVENEVYYYDTCVQLQPPSGYYFDLVGRSRIAKTGWTLANCIGILDNEYRGNVIVALVRSRPDAPELDLNKIEPLVQIIPRKIRHFMPVEVEALGVTSRGATGGLGSAQFAK